MFALLRGPGVSNLIQTRVGHSAKSREVRFRSTFSPSSLPGRCGKPVSHRGVHSHESQELPCCSAGRWLLRRDVHAPDEVLGTRKRTQKSRRPWRY